jgi:hypothetical protein
MFPQQHRSLHLPTVIYKFVLLPRAISSGTIIIIPLNPTPFDAAPAMEELSPFNIVSLEELRIKVGRVMSIVYQELGL